MALDSKALTTVSAVQDALGLSSGDQVTRIERLIHVISDAIITYAGRRFDYNAAIVEQVAGYGDHKIVVSRPPITSITLIELVDTDGSVSLTFDSTSYRIDNANAGIIYRPGVLIGSELPFVGYGWPSTAQTGGGIRREARPGSENKAIKVTYVGGWKTPNQVENLGVTGPRDLPWDLEEAAIMSIVYLHKNRGRDITIASKSTAEVSTSWRNPNELIGTEAGMLTPETRAIVDQYRRGFYG